MKFWKNQNAQDPIVSDDETVDIDAEIDSQREIQREARTQLTIIILGIITCILLFTFFFFLWRDVQKKSSREEGSQPERYVAEQNEDSTTNITSKYDEQVEKLIKKMSLEEKVYQLFLVSPETLCESDYVTVAGDTTKEQLAKKPVGGMIYSQQNIMAEDQITEMITKSQSYSKIPLFIATEEEGGPSASPISYGYNMNVTQCDDMATIGDSLDTAKAYNVGSDIGTYMSKMGFNLDLAPVADVRINSSNPIVSKRAFSDSADVVSKMVTQVVMGLENKKVSATLKHFPGEGSLNADPHNDYICVNDQSIEDIENYNLPPFKAGIAAGADFVMVSHAQIPALTGNDTPASLSEDIVKKLLREKMKFAGVIVTDNIQSVALANYCSEEDAVVKALSAGCDMILNPLNLDGCVKAITTAIKNGTLTEERINQSLERILRIKYKNINFSIAGTDVYKEPPKEEPKKEESTDQTGEQYYDPYGGQYYDPYGGDQYYDPYGGDQYYDPYGGDQYYDPYGGDQYYDPYGGQYYDPYYDPYAYY